MAEHFDGIEHTVHFSSAGGECLLHALIKIGERFTATEDSIAVSQFLCDSLNNPAGVAFSLNPPPEEIAAPIRLRCLAALLYAFVQELSQETPDPTLCDITWDCELRLKWAARVMMLHENVSAYLTSIGESTDYLSIQPS